MKISKHFTLEELAVTEHREYVAQNIEEAFAPDIQEKLTFLATTLLDPVRDRFGLPMHINSGYRCPDLNAAVKGATSSQHMKGEAADFVIPGVDLRLIFDWIRQSGLKYGQVIIECNAWIHLSCGEPYREMSRNRESLSAKMVNGKFVYTRV